MKKRKILLADDSATIRKVVELTFADEGFDVFSVADGDAAMQKFVEIEPDLVIADVHMPGISGYQICEMIKMDESTRHIPVILLVGSFETFDPGEASRVGSNYYFTKPFASIRELVEKVTDYIENMDAADSSGETDDIDDLYQDSFAATLEMPRDEPAKVDPIETLHADAPDNAVSGVEPVEPAFIRVSDDDPESLMANGDAEPAGLVDFDVLFDSRDSESVTEKLPDSIEVPEDSEAAAILLRPEYEPINISLGTEPASAILGDAGMDDEIIETTHPGDYEGTSAQVGEIRPAVSPFDAPAEGSTTPALERLIDDSEDVDNEERGAVLANEVINKAADAGSPLRIIIEDENENEISHESGHVNSGGASSTTGAISATAASPELIEMIANKVLERLSDRAVREAAQEAVPRIAEKLIREALDDDKKQ